MDSRNVYRFGGGGAEGGRELRNLLGGKGANLAEMARIGLPVPPGFTISTEVCGIFASTGAIPRSVLEEVSRGVEWIEEQIGDGLGSPESPLLLSVRSGARVSMPGMMDTVLDLGLNDEAVLGLASVSGDERFAWDCYRRLLQMFGDVVQNVSSARFEEEIAAVKRECGVTLDAEL